MGSMDGVALAKAVRKAGGTMQIVFVTGIRITSPKDTTSKRSII